MVTDFGIPVRWDLDALDTLIRRMHPENPDRCFELLLAVESVHVGALQEQIERSRPKGKKR